MKKHSRKAGVRDKARSRRERVLIIDDELPFIQRMTDYLDERFEVSCALSGRDGLKKAAEELPAVVLLDFKLEEGNDGLEVLKEIKARWSYINVILVSAYLDEKIVAAAEDLGVDECIPKNLKLDGFDRLILRAIERNLASRKAQLDERRREELQVVPVFDSPAMSEVRAAAERFRDLDESILVAGPPGSGKEVLARWIHFSSVRAAKPFHIVDLVSLEPGVLEEELFGRENRAAGAEGGAGGVTRGLLELAHGGTVVLDEIGDLSLAAQTKLLRAVEKKQFRRVGSDNPIAADVRFIVLTSRDLPALVRAGKLRSELYYRINTLRIDLPPLAERREDIPLLARQMLGAFALKFRSGVREIDPAAERRFVEYRWPGNVRELECVMKSAIIRAAGPSIALDDVAAVIGPPLEAGAEGAQSAELDLRKARGAWERSHCMRLLSMANGDVKEAAKLAGVPRESFYRLLRRFKIKAEEFRR